MDELLQHCIRELAFEGDLGCDASRLRDFIADYHRQEDSSQQVDDAYCAFVWSIVSQQPEVRVGTAPQGVPEVYIAPQFSKRDKAKQDEESLIQKSLSLIPDAASRSLDELEAQYGDALRIAVDPERSFVALTGSHIKPSSLTPPVYTCLQLIARGRENGLSAVDLNRKTGYDAKTCHYLIGKLLALNVIVKLKKSGVGTNLCIHKYFFDKSESWRAVFAEEEEVKNVAQGDEELDEDADADDGDTKPVSIRFDPIDVQHLARISIVRARLEKLLKNCPNHTHKTLNLLVAIGFSNPKKTERRFFQTRLRELEAEGFIETIQVRRSNGKYVKCIRLVSADASGDVDESEGQGESNLEEAEGQQHSFKATITLQRQMLDIIHASGTEGTTLNQLTDALNQFDKRVLDFQINHLRDPPPPPHLRHLGIEQTGETYGRERRYKYYTHDHYLQVAERESLETQFSEGYFDLCEQFVPVDESMFYQDAADFDHFVDNYRNLTDPSASAKSKKKSASKKNKETGGEDQPSQRGRKRKLEETIDDESASASVPGPPKKRGRPPKEPDSDSAVPKKRGRPSKQYLTDATVSAPAVPKKRGRPRKHPLPDPDEATVSAPAAPKKRGRPRKNPLPEPPGVDDDSSPPAALQEPEDDSMADPVADGSSTTRIDIPILAPFSASAPPVKRRGRPRKHLEVAVVVPPPPRTTAGPSHLAKDIADSSLAAESISAPVGRRSRRKLPVAEVASATVQEETVAAPDDVDLVLPEPASAPKRRGRLPKPQAVEETPKTPKRRGRLPKTSTQEQQVVSNTASNDIAATGAAEAEDGSTTAQTAPSAEIAHEVEPSSSLGNETDAADATTQSATLAVDQGVATTSEIAIDPALLEDETGVATPSQEVSTEGVSTAKPPDGVPAKRPPPTSPSASSSSKKFKTDWNANYRSRTNITQSRRQREVLLVLERVGGIINSSSKELYDEHAAEVEALSKAGELTSTLAGSRIDRRTMVATLDELESQGKIKSLKTIVTSPTGFPRQVRIVYLPDTPEDTVKEFLNGLTVAAPPILSSFNPLPSIKVVDELEDYGGSRSAKVSQPLASVILLDQGAKDRDPDRAAQLLRADEETTRASLLTEPNTVVQQYGFIVGKIARVKALHLHVMRLLEERSSLSIISPEKRIVHFSYFSQELPVSIYAAVVSCRVHSDELLQLLATPEGRLTPLRDLSPSIQEAFEIHKSRSRMRMLDNLGLLESLGLIVPLRETTDNAALYVTCEPRDSHPTTFERTICESGATTIAPQYWMFTSSAPLFMWALQVDEQDPPFYRHTSVTSPTEAEEFWGELQRISLDTEECKRTLNEMPAEVVPEEIPSQTVPLATARLLRRSTQWSTAYSFSWFQKQYLKKYTDVATATTPLQDEETGEARLAHIASIVCAPKDQVIRFYEHEHTKLLKDHKQIRARRTTKAKSQEEHRTTLAQKAAQAKAQREERWDGLIARLYPDPPKGTFGLRVRNLRSKFMQNPGRDMEKWENELKTAEEEVKLQSTRLRPSFAQMPPLPVSAPPPIAFSTQEKSVDDLIAQQMPLTEKKPILKKNKGKGKDEGKGKGKEKGKEKGQYEEEKQRRARFQWNKDLDELARDAAAVIKARCRGKRIQWAALDQVFIATTTNSVRQRILTLLDMPGQASYAKRLEDRWYELWRRHLGTPELPDEDPGSPTNFDLKAHITFLRNHVDKNAIRVGLVQTEQPDVIALPMSVDAMHDRWNVAEKVISAPTWDFLWTGPSEDGREKQMLQQAFVLEGTEVPECRQYATEATYVADAALKMTLATPNDVYNADRASQLLQCVDSDAYKTAVRDLQEQNVVSMLVRDPKRSTPGRPLKISDLNQNALGGSFAEEVYQDACALETLAAQVEEGNPWREWSLLSSDGDVAAMIELVSDGKLDFKVDTSRTHSARTRVDWNSKKADDDDIETAISVRYVDSAVERHPSPSVDDVIMQESHNPAPSMLIDNGSHGKTSDGEIACCAVTSTAGIVDCAECLVSVTEPVLGAVQPEDAQTMRTLLEALEDAGPEGLTKEELQKMVMRSVVHKLPEYVARFTSSSPPLAFWAGNKEIFIVSSHYASAWSVTVEQEDMKCVRMLPRRWLSIWGRVMPDVWGAACRAVMGIVHFHPGIPQTELRWRLKAVYDRQEVHDVLQYLLADGFLRRDVRSQSAMAIEGPPSNAEENAILWSTNQEKRWYQVILQN